MHRARDDEASERTGSATAAAGVGFIAGSLEVVIAVSFAALIFGSVPQALTRGLGLILASGVVVILITGLASRGRVIGSVQDSAAAILAVAVAAAVAHSSVDVESAGPTAIAVVAVATVTTGVAFLLLGTLRLGKLVRFIPYPVTGGFLAGTGWMLLIGSVDVAAGVPLSWATLGELVSGPVAARWAVGLAVLTALLIATERSESAGTIPLLLLVSVALVLGGIVVSGTSWDAAREAGWLFDSGGAQARLAPLLPGEPIIWPAVWAQAGAVATIVVVSALALLMNASGIEVATREDLDLDRELRSAGIGNLVVGGGGGMVGYHSLALTVLGRSAGPSLISVVSTAALPMVALIVGPSLLGYLPRPVFGGLLAYLAVGFITPWLVAGWRSLPRLEYATILVIVSVIALVGFLEGVAVGILVMLVLFVVDYSRTDAVKHELTLATYRSSVDRDAEARRVLDDYGEGVLILELRGHLFFGTASSALGRVGDRVRDDQPLHAVVLDLREVTGVDSSAVLAFVRAAQEAEAEGHELILSCVSAPAKGQLTAGGLPDSVVLAPDLDHAAERCEERLLAAELDPSTRVGLDTSLIELVRDRGEVRRLAEGEVLIQAGAEERSLAIVCRGRLRVQLDGDPPTRLRVVQPGAVIGELSYYLGEGRAATVLADTHSEVLVLDEDALGRIDREAPELAAALHRKVAQIIAERLVSSNRTVEALLR